MIKVLFPFCKNGKDYKKDQKASFTEHDEKTLVGNGFAELYEDKRRKLDIEIK